MTLGEYQQLCARTLAHPTKDNHQELKIAAMALGLAGEAGEVVDLLKKNLWHDKPLDPLVLAKELGDVLWYLSALATLHGLNLDTVAALNVEKLRARFPAGFTTAAANARADEVKP